MKRFVLSTIYVMALFVVSALTACNEYDEEDILVRESRTYEVVIKTSSDLTMTEQAIVNEALTQNAVDVATMRVETDDIGRVAKGVLVQLDEVQTAMMVGFRVEGRGDDRFAAKVLVAGYGED